MGYFSQNRHKFYLKCHTIFVCKYQKQLINENVRVFILSTFKQIEEKSDFEIEIMETDKGHIHLLINYPPTVSVSSIARRLKQISTIELWKQFPNILSKQFWKKHTFWSDGYFVFSIGEANPDTIRKYIENQG